MTHHAPQSQSGHGPFIEAFTGPFVMIRLPTLGSLHQLHGHALGFAVQQEIGALIEKHLGKHSLIWLRDRYGAQIHEPMNLSALQERIQACAHELSRGLTVTLDDHQTHIQWVNHPSIGVVTSCRAINLADRIARGNEVLRQIGELNHCAQPPLNIGYYQPEAERDPACEAGDLAPSDWRKEKVLRLALQDQALDLEFGPIRDAITEGLAGFRAQFRPLIRYDGMEIRLTHSEILAHAAKIGLKGELNLILLRNALNQCRIWNVLVPGNDATITIPMDADALAANQTEIFELLGQYEDVAARVIVAIEVNEDSVVASNPSSLNACITELNRKTGIRFALTDFGLSKLKLTLAQELDVHVVYLAGQWPETATAHNFSDPILPNLIDLLHSLRTEVVATNISTARQLDNLKTANIDRYERSARLTPALREDEALALIETHQSTIASTVINARYLFGKAT